MSRFDLDTIQESTNTTFDLVVGNLPAAKDGTPGAKVGFTLKGPGSAEFTKVERDIQIANIKTANNRKNPLDLATEEGAATVVDKGDEQRDMIIFACTVGWFGFTKGDQPAEFTQENLAAVLKARPHWARLIINAINEASNFEGA